VCNIFGLPIIVNASISIIAAGLGTAKISLRTADIIKVNIDDVNKTSQNFGAIMRKIKTNGKITSASPSCVIL